MIEGLVSQLPPRRMGSIEGLLRRAIATREHLLAELDAYTRRIDDSARRRPGLKVRV